MRFEEPQQRSKQGRLAHAAPQLIRPDSGQVEEPLRPTLTPKRCRKRGEGKSHRIIVVCAQQGLEQP